VGRDVVEVNRFPILVQTEEVRVLRFHLALDGLPVLVTSRRPWPPSSLDETRKAKKTVTTGEDSVEALRPDVAAMRAKVRGLESYNHLFCSASAIAAIKMSALADRLVSEPRAILSMAMAKSRKKLFQKVKIKLIVQRRAEESEHNQASPNGEFRFFKS
jgi:hypothetical protein